MSKRKLLLADDSITIQKVVNLTFADEGIEVISVGDGDSAMRKFEEFIPDLVMADVNMPGLTGYEVCHIIKHNEVTQHIPVILLVGSFEPFDEEAAKEAGADDYLTKPFQSIRQLVNKVTDLLNKSSAPAVETAPEVEPAAEATQVPVFEEPLAYQDQEAVDQAPVAQFDYSSDFDPYVAPAAETAENSLYDSPVASITDYGDSEFDDEMIETSPASSFGAEPVAEYQAENAIDFAKTQPLNAADLKGFSLLTDRDEVDPEPEKSTSVAEAESNSYEIDADAEASLYDYDTTPAQVPVSEPVAESVSAPFELERVTDDPKPESEEMSEIPVLSELPEPEENVVAETETAEEIDEISYMEPVSTRTAEFESEQAAAYREAEPETAELAVTEKAEATDAETADVVELEGAEVEVPTASVVEDNAPEIDFDDGDLLELPPLVEETGIRPSNAGFVMEAPIETPMETVTVSPAEQVVEREVEREVEPEVEPVDMSVSDPMTSFPPELIEAIARKVAEQISAKTMADILPQITELVMKKMAEEKKD